MLKNKFLTDEKLHLLLKQKGIYTSLLRITGIEKQNYLRVTIRSEEDNHFLVQKCHEIEKEIAQSINIDSYSLNYS
jgi:histidinol-phosphate/aromatic aminotransferase/cobyric acid decarboxylase-like protein